nr:capsid protein [Tick-associated circular DNA virus]
MSDSSTSGLKMVFRTRKKYLKGMKRILAPQILNSVPPGLHVTSATSRQSTTSLNMYQGSSGLRSTYVFSAADVADMFAILRATDPTPASTTGGVQTTATRKMMVKSVKTKTVLKNMTNSPVQITLYDCVLRRDVSSTGAIIPPEDTWQAGLANETVLIPGAPNTNAQLQQMPGAKPFQSQQFCQYWKVKRSKTFVLHTGSEHIHYITIKPGGLFSAEYNTRFNGYKGLTTALLMVLKGPIADDAVADPNRGVGYGASAVSVITEYTANFTCMERSSTNYTQFNVLPTAGIVNTALEDVDTISTIAMA